MQYKFQTTPEHRIGQIRINFRDQTTAPPSIVQIVVGSGSEITATNVLQKVKLAIIVDC